MQLGRLFGFLFLVIGGFIAAMMHVSLRDDGQTIEFLIAGPALALIGIAMLIFPGGNITAEESKTKQKEPSVVFKEAPASHKIAWVVAGIAGVVLALNWGIFL
ncbi:MAG: hypothetical protein EOO93_08645 [Pedobacter sp.]|nr:MAG: hypothetical protein EOO93_08645 [Pedobacter sp.]